MVNTPAPPPVPDELAAVLRRMRLPYVRAAAPEVLATARAQRWDPAEVLRVLLAEEAAGRDQATRRMRRRTAALPTGKTFDAWKSDVSSIPAPTQAALRTWNGSAARRISPARDRRAPATITELEHVSHDRLPTLKS